MSRYRFIYRYAFPSRRYGEVVYIGQTNNPRRRDYEHKWENWGNQNKLLRHAFSFFPDTKMKVVVKVPAYAADEMESKWIASYPHVLNKVDPITGEWLPNAIQKPTRGNAGKFLNRYHAYQRQRTKEVYAPQKGMGRAFVPYGRAFVPYPKPEKEGNGEAWFWFLVLLASVGVGAYFGFFA